MLSIQYVYERILLCFALFVPAVRLPLKAAAKVQLLFNPTSFFKKNISIFLLYSISLNSLLIANCPLLILPFLAVGRAKIISFPFIKQAFFNLFFLAFPSFKFFCLLANPLSLSFSCAGLLMNLSLIAGAKVILLLSFQSPF